MSWQKVTESLRFNAVNPITKDHVLRDHICSRMVFKGKFYCAEQKFSVLDINLSYKTTFHMVPKSGRKIEGAMYLV